MRLRKPLRINVTNWQWDNSDPFGNNPPNENPSGQGTFTNNLRFPGQYFEIEIGLFQNHFREYDPANGGRHVESDPIGLAGGINTYTYGLLFGLDAGESYVDSAAQYWADRYVNDTGLKAGLDAFMGGLASLWTPCTSNKTATVLAGGAGIGRYLGRSFWQYYPADRGLVRCNSCVIEPRKLHKTMETKRTCLNQNQACSRQESNS